MNKKQLKEEALKLIRKMEVNTFLLPDSWTDEIMMSDGSIYKTYVGNRGSTRYINLEYKEDGVTFTINFRGEKVLIDGNDVFAKPIKPERVYQIVRKVYDEKHSFVENAEGKKSILLALKSQRDAIISAKKKITELEKQLQDFDILSTSQE